jgi:hypothetical protein
LADGRSQKKLLFPKIPQVLDTTIEYLIVAPAIVFTFKLMKFLAGCLNDLLPVTAEKISSTLSGLVTVSFFATIMSVGTLILLAAIKGELSNTSKPVLSFTVDAIGSRHNEVTSRGTPSSAKASLIMVFASENGESNTKPRTWVVFSSEQ